jgi:dipeptidyl aminopeptidase/acylaminoacyl peptidase
MTNLLGRETLDAETVKLLAEISPINHIRPGLPPFLLVQGTADKTVAYDLTQNFQARLQAAGVSCELLTLENAQHRLADWKKFDPDFPEKIINWLNAKLPEK